MLVLVLGLVSAVLVALAETAQQLRPFVHGWLSWNRGLVLGIGLLAAYGICFRAAEPEVDLLGDETRRPRG